MPDYPSFQPFSATHVATLLITFMVVVGAGWLSKWAIHSTARQWQCYVLAVMLVGNEIADVAIHGAWGTLNLYNVLPMHLCDWAVITALLALLGNWQLMFELTYFWGMGGTLQALLTPDLEFGWPDPRFFTFFISHALVIVTLAVLLLGKSMRPQPGWFGRVFWASQIYIVSAGGVNYLCDTNYGFLCEKTVNISMLDFIGPWPIYLIWMQGIGIVSIFVYYLPFYILHTITCRSAVDSQQKTK